MSRLLYRKAYKFSPTPSHTHIDAAQCQWAFGWTVLRELPSTFELPQGYGSSYVDIGLKVIVESANSTLTAFQPNHLHGTTYSGGAINYGLSMTMTERVKEGYEEMKTNGNVVFAHAATNEHTD